MGHWEDFWWDTHKQLDELGLRTKFDEQLKKMRYQDKYQYMESKERWRYALDEVIKASDKIKTKSIK
jgi:Spy/CpxP family protein refolding chaperone